MAGPLDYIARILRRPSRRRIEPSRETISFPRLQQLGSPRSQSRGQPTYKPIARNLRYFSRTPYARRAINTIRNPVCQLEWEISPLPGVTMTNELARQIEIATYCFDHPNYADSFTDLVAMLIEDICCGAGAIETEIGLDDERPLWMWPVDGLSVQQFALWDGSPTDPRYYQTVGYGSVGNLGTDGIALRDDELMYFRPNPSTADPFGYGPLEVAFLAISRKLGVADFAGTLASNAKPSSGLQIQGANDDQIAAFRGYWRNEIEGQGVMPIMGGTGATALRFYPDGDNGLFLKWQEFCIREIGVAFDLSAGNFNLERDVNRSTAEVAEDRDWDMAIKPMARGISDRMTRHALHKKLGFHQLRHQFLGLDREDEVATAGIFEKYYKNNTATPNEQRAKIGMAPSKSKWADLHFADVQIAIEAARGMKVDLDPDLDVNPNDVLPGAPLKNPDPPNSNGK